MSASDKFSNKAEELKGRAKEAYGDVADDEEKQAEGKADKGEAKVKKAGEAAKDKVNEAARKLTD